MNTSVVMTQDFQTRIFEKIRNDIGSLMSDEDIKKLVETTIEREFFTPIKRVGNNSYSYNSRDEYDPPKIHKLVSDLVEPTLRKAIDKWLLDNPVEIEKCIKEALAGGLSTAVLRAFDYKLQDAMINLRDTLSTVFKLK